MVSVLVDRVREGRCTMVRKEGSDRSLLRCSVRAGGLVSAGGVARQPISCAAAVDEAMARELALSEEPVRQNLLIAHHPPVRRLEHGAGPHAVVEARLPSGGLWP